MWKNYKGNSLENHESICQTQTNCKNKEEQWSQVETNQEGSKNCTDVGCTVALTGIQPDIMQRGCSMYVCQFV